MGRIGKRVEIAARGLAKLRFRDCGGMDACTMVKGTPNWRFCIPDASAVIHALDAEEARRLTATAAAIRADVQAFGGEE